MAICTGPRARRMKGADLEVPVPAPAAVAAHQVAPQQGGPAVNRLDLPCSAKHLESGAAHGRQTCAKPEHKHHAGHAASIC